MANARASEDGLIARYFAPLAAEGGLGLKDDTALVSPRPGHDLVLTADGIVSGIHFFPDDPPASIARKALGVNVSDLAAKGADPRGFLLTLMLPDDWTEAWLAEFAGGLGEVAAEWGCPLLGGDTTRAGGGLALSITAIGEVPCGTMVPRTGARPGDTLVVSGTVGDAALGLVMRGAVPSSGGIPPDDGAESRAYLIDRYLHPRPRVGLATALRAHAHAALDVSDGLVGDLAKMMRASRTSAEVDLDAVPLSPAAREAIREEPELWERAMTGGDDYEILATVPPSALDDYLAAAAAAGVPATAIGTVRGGETPPVFRREGREVTFASGSFSHF